MAMEVAGKIITIEKVTKVDFLVVCNAGSIKEVTNLLQAHADIMQVTETDATENYEDQV